MNALEYMGKSTRALAAARLLLAEGDVEGACNRAYYAMFDAAHAALIAAGAASAEDAAAKTHRGLIGAFGLHLVKPGHIAAGFGSALNKVERLRRLADYMGEPISMVDAVWAVDQAGAFVDAMRSNFMPVAD